jgi:hypothetical protein
MTDAEVYMPMDPAQWTGDAHMTGPMKLSAVAEFDGPSDACAAVSVYVGTAGADEDQTIEARILVRDGMFDVNLARLGDGSFQIGIRARERSDGEIDMLADSLRWLAGQLTRSTPKT